MFNITFPKGRSTTNWLQSREDLTQAMSSRLMDLVWMQKVLRPSNALQFLKSNFILSNLVRLIFFFIDCSIDPMMPPSNICTK